MMLYLFFSGGVKRKTLSMENISFHMSDFSCFCSNHSEEGERWKKLLCKFWSCPLFGKKEEEKMGKKSSSSPFENWREQHEICSSFAILKDDEDDDFDVVTSIVIMDFGQSQKKSWNFVYMHSIWRDLFTKRKKSRILLTKKSWKNPWNFVYMQASQWRPLLYLTIFFWIKSCKFVKVCLHF